MDIRPEQTVADLIIQHPEWREKMEKMDIDYCCGGKRTLGQAVAAAGLEWQAFVVALNDTSAANAADSVHTNWNEVPLGEFFLFPAIKEIDAFISGRGRKPLIHCDSVANPIR